MSNLLDKIKSPPVHLRPVPFWSWNDRLDPEEIAEQIRAMHAAGIGGYFMHARGGLQTEYLSEDWFACVGAGIDTGAALGMRPWLYDEEGWPSGFGGGKVTALGDAYHARGLACAQIEGPGAAPATGLLGLYALHGNTAEPYRDGMDFDSLWAVTHEACPFYIDVMSREAVAAFLSVTHEAYYARFGDRFGKDVIGFFTDEPRITRGVPWSYTLPDAFRARYGYDLPACLPALFLDVDGYARVRHDFWTLVSELFVQNFMRQIYDWCNAHNCQLTGHVMMEENLYSQMAGTAGSMPFYEYMHVPGVDWLRRSMGSPVMTKQVGSAAEQLGKEQVITETYALSGWDLRPEEMRWMAAWQYVSGVNLMCQHLEGYTLRGLRKRDYPPSLFGQLPWWDEYRRVNDWLSGMAAALTSGRKIVNLALLHPMRSAYIAYNGGNTPALQGLDDALADAAQRLAGLHLDYHFADETLMAGHGGIDARGRLVIGRYAYSAVVLPDMLSIASHTLSLLERFAQGGGLIVALGRVPAYVDGVPSARAARLPVTRFYKDDQLLSLLAPLDEDRVSVRCGGVPCGDIRVCRFADGESRVAFLVNTSKQAAYDATVSIPGRYAAAEISPEDGAVTPLPCRHEDGHTHIPARFDPMRTLLLHLTPATQATPAAKQDGTLMLPLAPDSWQIDSMGDNALTLDMCAYAVDDGPWEGPVAVIHLMKRLLALRRPCDLRLRFSFTLAMPPERLTRLALLLETPERFTLAVNGTALPHADEGWAIDKAFRRRDILRYVRQGENEITLDTRFYQSPHVYEALFGEGVYETELNKLTYDTELESLYLLGDFGVTSAAPYTPRERNGLTTAGPFTLGPAPQTLAPGSFTQQGLAFYQGRLAISCTLHVPEGQTGRVLLRLPAPRAATVALEVNGQPVKAFLWAPYEADVTGLVRPGGNHIRLTLTSGLRNLLGPHHHIDGELYNVGPASFSGEYSWCERPTEGTPDLPELRGKSFWTDDYTFVTFGIG